MTSCGICLPKSQSKGVPTSRDIVSRDHIAAVPGKSETDEKENAEIFDDEGDIFQVKERDEAELEEN